MPAQNVPFPINPRLHLQLKEPLLFAQSAFASHGLRSEEHSSISRGMKEKKNFHNRFELNQGFREFLDTNF